MPSLYAIGRITICGLSGCYAEAVRRWTASLLLVLLSLLPLQPLLVEAQQQAGVPVCCRRNGAHHCMMMQQGRSGIIMAQKAGIFAPSRCPQCRLGVVPASAATLLSLSPVLAQPIVDRYRVIDSSPFLHLSQVAGLSARAPPDAHLS